MEVHGDKLDARPSPNQSWRRRRLMEGGAPRSSPDLRCGGGDRRGARGGGDGTGPRAGGAARGGVAVMGLSRDGGGGSGGWGAVADRRIGAGSGEVGTNPDFFGGGTRNGRSGG
jgi:hypothetical protein